MINYKPMLVATLKLYRQETKDGTVYYVVNECVSGKLVLNRFTPSHDYPLDALNEASEQVTEYELTEPLVP